MFFFVFFFNDTATTEIYTLSLHDALPIYDIDSDGMPNYPFTITDVSGLPVVEAGTGDNDGGTDNFPDERMDETIDFGLIPEPEVKSSLAIKGVRSEEHTSELQSHSDLVCRLLLEKKKEKKTKNILLIINFPSHVHNYL